MSDKKSFIYALATFVGTVIGVGLFGLPYVGAKVGFGIMFIYLVLMAGLVMIIHLFYGEFAFRTKGLHRLPGYAAMYLGPVGKRATLIVQLLGIFGSLLAYLIVGGQFLSNFFGGSVYLYTFIFFLLGAWLIWQDQKSIGLVELILLIIFISLVIFFFIAGVGDVQMSNLSTANMKYLFVPYGILLFSYWGASIIPEMKELLSKDEKKLKRVIMLGIVICLAIYLLFSFLVIGISGANTTTEGIAGLQGHLGKWILMIGYVFGVITTFTSFITLGLTMKKILWYDYKFPKWLAWLLTCFVPVVLFSLGFKDFIDIIGLTGAITLGLEGVIITLIYLKFKKQEGVVNFNRLKTYSTLLITLFVVGVVLEIIYSFVKF